MFSNNVQPPPYITRVRPKFSGRAVPVPGTVADLYSAIKTVKTTQNINNSLQKGGSNLTLREYKASIRDCRSWRDLAGGCQGRVLLPVANFIPF